MIDIPLKGASPGVGDSPAASDPVPVKPIACSSGKACPMPACVPGYPPDKRSKPIPGLQIASFGHPAPIAPRAGTDGGQAGEKITGERCDSCLTGCTVRLTLGDPVCSFIPLFQPLLWIKKAWGMGEKGKNPIYFTHQIYFTHWLCY